MHRASGTGGSGSAATGTGGGARVGAGNGSIGAVTVREGVRVGKNTENKYEDAKSVERVVRNCVGNMENNQRAKKCCYGTWKTTNVQRGAVMESSGVPE